MVNSYLIVYCAITCIYLELNFHQEIQYNYNNVQYIMINGNILWRGGRGKAERAKGRAGSKTSGESVGKGIMINTCI